MYVYVYTDMSIDISETLYEEPILYMETILWRSNIMETIL